jgi:F420-non-reducing hydrogenase iron-sulfur subunit
MKARGLDIRRLRLTAICTVCTRAFLNEVRQMNDLISELGPPGNDKPAAASAA